MRLLDEELVLAFINDSSKYKDKDIAISEHIVYKDIAISEHIVYVDKYPIMYWCSEDHYLKFSTNNLPNEHARIVLCVILRKLYEFDILPHLWQVVETVDDIDVLEDKNFVYPSVEGYITIAPVTYLTAPNPTASIMYVQKEIENNNITTVTFNDFLGVC